MKYSEILKHSIIKSGFSLNMIAQKLKNYDVHSNKSYLSKLQNGAYPPANEKINNALASVLSIDPIMFNAAACKDRIPEEIFRFMLNEALSDACSGEKSNGQKSVIQYLNSGGDKSYSKTLSDLIRRSNLSLGSIVKKLEHIGVSIDRSYLSKLKTGVKPAASDRTNIALAQVLGIEPTKLLITAYREKIPTHIFQAMLSEFSENKCDSSLDITVGMRARVVVDVSVKQIQVNSRGTEIVVVDDDQNEYTFPMGDERLQYNVNIDKVL